MILALIAITLLYLLLIGALIFGFDKVPGFKIEDIPPKTKCSVIIPFRNEAEHLPALLKSVVNLNYPKTHFEIIFVDDDSKDASVDIILKAFETSQTNFKVIKNKRTTNSPKKDAITSAIKIAKNDWIVTTDADCVLPKFWLDSIDCFIQKNDCKMIVAPVCYFEADSVLKRFQLLDFLSLIGATIGGFGIAKPFLCNGANFAYEKSLFTALDGFSGNDKVASGDDIFMLEKAIKQDKNAVKFLKTETAIVRTKPQPNLKSLIAQRKRWAAKTSQYHSVFGKTVGIIVLLMNAGLVSGLILVLAGLFNLKPLLYIFAIKSLIDFLLLFKTARFFNQENYLSNFMFSCLLYPFFSVYIAFIAMFSSYKWKGRTFKK
ncbi:glycosyltransferase family 2 protein [Lacinutrix chionoecetis]